MYSDAYLDTPDVDGCTAGTSDAVYIQLVNVSKTYSDGVPGPARVTARAVSAKFFQYGDAAPSVWKEAERLPELYR